MSEGSSPQRHVRMEVDRGVGLLTVDRPPANALDLELVLEIARAAAEAAACAEVGALVLTGAGPRFVAGADIKMMNALPAAEMPRFISSIQRAMDDIEAIPIPTVAAVNGHAMGGGLELALACDVRMLAEGARIGLPEVKLGLLPGAGGTQRLAEVVGKGRALDILYTGRQLDAAESLALGLVNSVHPREGLLAAAVDYAAALALGARPALRELKACVLAHLDGGRHVGLRAEASGIARLFATPDAREGIAAFVEKRPARFGTAGPA
ncbi:enoyl-CoA hydratase/isomerase family protein [Pseudonocardia sp. WMMC193]|uniref:enoyl-CoA hydratase/isomerase family protein n=1 Tax=Pseudonocardia sp. WMMC193 TaxID=2911965 RepID=UPI001F025D2F|nr:enoyl-CoA hydratase-related protein [Pseudonocardia sp. WMMC193]MCF7550788.1 enoyl-CoA hydratase-related protein [Pseudonocardia sp. WMMC193]